MSEYRDMSMINLYSSLGYERKSSRRKFETLDAATQAFFREYTDQGNKISLSTVNVEGARLCALNFLHEDDRGELYFPANSDRALEWANDRHRETITDVLTHIFRKKAFSDYVKERKEVRDREAEAEGLQNEKPKRVKKRSRKLPDDDDDDDDDDDYQSFPCKEPVHSDEAFIPSSLEPTTVKPWNDPPQEPCAKFCGNYIRRLNPKYDSKPVAGFQKKWLSTKDSKWPIQADDRLLRFMFDQSFFMTYDHGDDLSAELLRVLKQGSEIEEMKPSEVVKFRDRVKDRIAELTKLLTTKPYFILAYRRDGVVRMTERFERMWKNKEAYWEEESPKSNVGGPRPVKKRKKSKAVRAKTPIVFPNLHEEDDTMSELLSAQIDMGSRMQLASMAETALELSVDQGREELEERRVELSFFAEFMNVDSESELNVPAPEQTFTKSDSPNDIIEVESERTEGSQSPHNTPPPSSSQENQNLEKEYCRTPTLESIASLNSEAQQGCILTTGMPTQPISTSPSTKKMPAAKQITAITTNEKPLAKKPQETIDKLFTPMRDLSEVEWSRASANQSVSPTESTTSRSLGRTESTSTSILSSQHVQETTTIGCGGTISASPPTLHAEFSWLDPQQLTTTGSMHSVNRSSSGDNAQASIPTSGHNSCRPQHVSQGFKDRELEYVDHQNSSSTPGSSRSAPFQIVDDHSDYPHSPSTASTKLSSPFIKTPSPQNRQQTSEPVNNKNSAAVQPRHGNPSSPNSMSLHSILGSEADYRPPKLLYHHHTIGKKLEAPSTSPHTFQPTLNSESTGSSPRGHLPTVNDIPRENFHVPSSDERRNRTSVGPSSSGSGLFSAHYQSSEHPHPPTREGIVKRKAGPWPFRPTSVIQIPGSSNMVLLESNNNESPVMEGMQDSCSNWRSRNTSVTNPVTLESQDKNYAPSSAFSMSNMSPEIFGSKSPSPPGCEAFEKPINRTSSKNQSPSQGSGCVQQQGSVIFPLQKSASTSPTESTFQSQRLSATQSPRHFLKTVQSPEASSSTILGCPNSLNNGTTTIGHKKAADVDNFINYIDDFIQRERNTVVRKEKPSNPTSYSDPDMPDQSLPSQSIIPRTAVTQGQPSTSEKHQSPSLSTTEPVQCHSPSRDLTPRFEKRIPRPIQEPVTPPTQDGPHRRNGSYSFVPPPEAFSPYKSATAPPPDTRVPPAPVLSTDTRLTTTSASSGASSTPTLTLLIESADGSMSLETAHAFEIVENSSLSEFFQFYSSISGTPLSSLTTLELQPAFGKRPSYEIRRYGGEDKWKRAKEVILSLFDRAVRKDRGGRMEWQVLVSSG